MNLVFGYGSLVDTFSLRKFLGRDKVNSNDWIFCRLNGYRRVWNVAMDNSKVISGYKYYIDPSTGTIPDVSVTFLNIRKEKASSISGILFQVSDEEIKIVDKREHNYNRVDVSDKIDIDINGKIWVYIAKKNSIDIYKKAFKQGNAVISENYYNMVYNAFKSYGESALKDYISSTDKPEVKLKKLQVVKLDDSSS